jgi:peroxiredoxin
MKINDTAIDFELEDLEGASHRLSDYRGRIVIVNFWSCECPHSERTDRSMMANLVQWDGEVVMLTIASNANERPEDIREAARARRLPLVLMDPGNQVADMYEAQTTPHAYVMDRQGILRYRGAVDDVAPGRRVATRFFVEEAVETLVDGRLPDIQEQRPFGCTIVRSF